LEPALETQKNKCFYEPILLRPQAWLTFLVFFSFSFFASANTYTVTNTNASGPGSLDQAIQDANGNVGADIINFAIPGPPPFIIQPTTFPGITPITDAVTINGYTQPGSAMAPMYTISPLRVSQIFLLGPAPGPGFFAGLTINADNVEISGLSIGGFNASGITVLNGHDNIYIWGNFIGMDPSGVGAAPNALNGINLGENDGGGSTNVIIGTNSDGTADTDEGNLISSNGQDGILGVALTNSIISGNFFGSDRSGTGSFANLKRDSASFPSTGNRIGTNGDNTNDVQEANGIINSTTGILILANSNNNVVSGNIIGLNTAQAAAGNGIGIQIWNSSSNRIGVNTADANFAGEANVISSNINHGISLFTQTFFSDYRSHTDNIISEII
jgi:hypothetical protein